MNKKLTFLLALTFLFLFGCAVQGKWVKADSTERDWSRDMSDCIGLVAEANINFARAFNNCLIGKGWDYVDEQGNPIRNRYF